MSKSLPRINPKILKYGHWQRFWRPSRRRWSDIPPNRRSRNLRRRGKFGCLTTPRNCMPTTKRRAAVYGLESSDTSDTPMLRCGRGRLLWQYRCLCWHIKKQVLKTMMCALVCGACIGLYLRLYRSVFDCIGLVLVNVLASVLARIEKRAFIWSVLARIIISYIPNTNVIHANTCWFILARIAIHTNTCTMYLACIMVCIVVCIDSVFAGITIQYVPNTNTIHTNTDRYVLNTYLLVLNTCWYVLNTYHQYIRQYMPQYMPIHRTRIGMYCVAIHANSCI